MAFHLRTTNLRQLNSATKYPSIPTYHLMGDRGELTLERVSFPGPVLVTEKVDGTNARIILTPDGEFVLGSRENLLAARGDLIGDPAMGIVEHLRATAEALIASRSQVTVFYGELYGAKISPGNLYTGEGRVGWRLFDVAFIPFEELTFLSVEQIEQWREKGGQRWASEEELTAQERKFDVPLTPRIASGVTLPTDPSDVLEWLRETLPKTLSGLDSGGTRKPEGVVVRTPDRRVIAKIRYADYERAVRKQRSA